MSFSPRQKKEMCSLGLFLSTFSFKIFVAFKVQMSLKEKNKQSIKVIFQEQTASTYVCAFQELAAAIFPSVVTVAFLSLTRNLDPSLQEFPFKQPPHPPPSLRNHNSSLNTLERNSFSCSIGRLMRKHQSNLILDHSDNTLDPYAHLFKAIYSPPDTAGSTVIHCGAILLCSSLGGRKGGRDGGGNQESDCSGEHRYRGVG